MEMIIIGARALAIVTRIFGGGAPKSRLSRREPQRNVTKQLSETRKVSTKRSFSVCLQIESVFTYSAARNFDETIWLEFREKKKLMRCAYFGVYVFNRKKFDFYFSSKWYKATYQLNIGRFVNENSEDSKNRKREERNDKHGFCKNARVFQHFPATHRHSHRSVGFSFHRIAACFHLLLFFIIAFVFFFSSRFCFLGVCCSFLWLHMRKM